MIQNINIDDRINGLKVKFLHKMLSKDNDLLVIKKHTFGLNIPNKDTYLTQNHKIYYNTKLVPGYILMKKYKNISFTNLGQLPIYNIELEKYSNIIANNMLAESYTN